MNYKITYESAQGNGVCEFTVERYLAFPDIQNELQKKLGFIPTTIVQIEQT